jgi:hypothetical protein
VNETVTEEGIRLYQCDRCGFLYEEKEWAEKCEQWCSAHGSCNMDITDHGVQRKAQQAGRE